MKRNAPSRVPGNCWRLLLANVLAGGAKFIWRAMFFVLVASGGRISPGQVVDRQVAEPPGVPPAAADEAVDFSRDVRPILAQHCWSCHGPDETTREAGLRLDKRESAVLVRPGSQAAIVPGRPADSLLIARIESHDAAEVMPPPAAKKPLTELQRATLRRWVEQGAEYAGHWAFTGPVERPWPTVRQRAAVRSPVDVWIQSALERRAITPTSPAPLDLLARRAALDLTGLPLAEPLSDEDRAGPDAYERLVDRLLASPRYAERMAMQWLDAARYADTNGYNNDEERTMWPWRDWVIRAFQRQMPFDQFLTEQLAGDLLDSPSLDQHVATGFHRNHAATTEGGIIEEEYRVEYVAERVHTTSSVFLGLSLQCARCHDHKYDPFSQREYYQFFAFFNQLPQVGATAGRAGAAEPTVKVPTTQQLRQLEQLAARQQQLSAAWEAHQQSLDQRLAAWEAKLTDDERQKLGPSDLQLHLPLDERDGAPVMDRAAMPPRALTVVGKAHWTEGRVRGALKLDGQTYLDGGSSAALAADRPFTIAIWLRTANDGVAAVLSKMDDAGAFRGYDITLENGRVALHLIDHWPDDAIKVQTKNSVEQPGWHQLTITYDGSRRAAGVTLYWDGKAQELELVRDSLRGTLATDKPFHLGRRQSSLPYRGELDDLRIYGRAVTPAEALELAQGAELSAGQTLLAVKPAERTPAQREQLRRFYLDRIDEQARRLQAELAELPKQREAIEKSVPLVMVMQDQPTLRVTQILRRGQYDQPGESVTAAVPAVFVPLGEKMPANRLALARWLTATAPAHPLTARVAVNRWWESYYGLGLVETLEDFGLTGSSPTHPELLDWLARRLLDSGWDTLAMQRLLVTTTAYRRSSQATAARLAVDPKNQWLGRGPRYRLSAETVRDQALAVSGLFVERLGGPSVKPYQPDGLWEDVTVERRHKYEADSGAGLYRRSMYTFWKRTCPPPTMSAFDAPSRETCTIRRARTNTPLQALVLLNDPTYVEAARKWAEGALAATPQPAAARAAATSGDKANAGGETSAGEKASASKKASVAGGVDTASLPDRGAMDQARVRWLYERLLSRPPEAAEETVVLRLLADSRALFTAEPERATQLLSVGRAARDERFSPSELAAWTIVCDTLFNLDEAITKP